MLKNLTLQVLMILFYYFPPDPFKGGTISVQEFLQAAVQSRSLTHSIIFKGEIVNIY